MMVARGCENLRAVGLQTPQRGWLAYLAHFVQLIFPTEY
jgi:hypothetical protein